MLLNLFFLFLIIISSTNIGFSQSAIYKEAAKITDSSDYYLEVGLFNKEDKKSYSKAILFTEQAIEYAKKNKWKIVVERKDVVYELKEVKILNS